MASFSGSLNELLSKNESTLTSNKSSSKMDLTDDYELPKSKREESSSSSSSSAQKPLQSFARRIDIRFCVVTCCVSLTFASFTRFAPPANQAAVSSNASCGSVRTGVGCVCAYDSVRTGV